MSRSLLTEQQANWLLKNYQGLSCKDLTIQLNRQFGTKLSSDQIQRWKNVRHLKSGLTGQFKKGSIPWDAGLKGWQTANGGSWKKGQKGINYHPLGSKEERADGYMWIKVGEPHVWQSYHSYLWEQYHKQKVPQGYVVIFGDRNKRNFNPHNLVLIARSELALLNKYHYAFENTELTKTGLNIVRLKIKQNEVKN